MFKNLLNREDNDYQKDDNELEMLSFNLGELMNGLVNDIPLKREDRIVIASKMDMREAFKVRIEGEVLKPGEFEFAEKMKLQTDIDITAILENVITSHLFIIVSQLKDLGFETQEESRYSRTVRNLTEAGAKSLRKAASETGLSKSQLLSACIQRSREQYGLSFQNDDVDKVDRVCRALQKAKTRATYGAVSDHLVGYSPPMLMAGKLRDHLHSWVVNRQSGLPSGYKLHEIDPDLTINDTIFKTKEEIDKLMKEYDNE